MDSNVVLVVTLFDQYTPWKHKVEHLVFVCMCVCAHV